MFILNSENDVRWCLGCGQRPRHHASTEQKWSLPLCQDLFAFSWPPCDWLHRHMAVITSGGKLSVGGSCHQGLEQSSRSVPSPSAQGPCPSGHCPWGGTGGWEWSWLTQPCPWMAGGLFHSVCILCCSGVMLRPQYRCKDHTTGVHRFPWWQSPAGSVLLPPGAVVSAADTPRCKHTAFHEAEPAWRNVWPAVVLGLACVLQHFPPGSTQGREAGLAHPPGSLRRASGYHLGLNSHSGAQQHPAASAGILLGSGVFPTPSSAAASLFSGRSLCAFSLPLRRQAGASPCAVSAPRRERDAGWQPCRDGHLPRRAQNPLGTFRGLLSMGCSSGRARLRGHRFPPRNPSLALAAFLHLATSGVSWVGRGPVPSSALLPSSLALAPC